jgi:CIC family chloride channel protein
LFLALVAPIAGAVLGAIDGIFRLALERADHVRNLLIAWGHQNSVLGFCCVVAGCSAGLTIGVWLVRRFSPYAVGSGIPQVEAAMNGHLAGAPPNVIPVKFFGGILVVGAGAGLGREGPSIQMGAVIAHHVGRLFRRNAEELRLLLAAGAGAGLAVAFNAPLAGAVFVLEELVKRFEVRMAIIALAASSTAILIARLFTGSAPDFHVIISTHAASAIGPLPYATAAAWPLYVGVGVVAGIAASLYTRTYLGLLALADRMSRAPVELRAAAVGAVVGIIGWFFPWLIGGGGAITQRLLSGDVATSSLPFVFVVRFFLGPVSYATHPPAGLLAPLLVVGTVIGLAGGELCQAAFPHLGIAAEAFAVVGMAAFFAGVVQAPVTGMVLVTEMTAAVATLLPMLAACFAALLVAQALNTAPVYDALLERLMKQLRH